MDIFRKILNPVMTGLDASVGNVVTDPSQKNVGGFIRDVAIETLPGDQRTNLDVNYGEGTVKTGVSLRDRGLIDTGIHRNVQSRAGNLRETVAEKGVGAGLRKAGAVFGRRIPAMVGRTIGGSSASGGTLAIPLAIWAVGDTLDTAAEAITGRGLLDHAMNPGAISTKDRQKYRHYRR